MLKSLLRLADSILDISAVENGEPLEDLISIMEAFGKMEWLA
jgi:hypothetical protein